MTPKNINAFIKHELSGWSRAQFAWLTFCELSILGISILLKDSPIGIIAALTGIAYTIFAGKGKISCFFFGIINTPIYAYLAWKYGYYGDMALNIYYFAMMFVGIAAWRRNTKSDTGLIRERLSRIELFAWSAAITITVVAFAVVLNMLNGTNPVLDSLTNILSIAAMILTVKRCVEQWAMWTAVNAIEVLMWFKVWSASGNSISLLLMWLLFLANGIYLWRIWVSESSSARQN
jgi:nicotinamide mononucleotide transporter